MNTIVILNLHSPVFVVLVITRGGGEGGREIVIVPSSMFATRCELESTPLPQPFTPVAYIDISIIYRL
jgi:hypothetical protein